jgi:hypothetical protein
MSLQWTKPGWDRRIRLAVAAIRTAQGHLEEAERLTWRLSERKPLERHRKRLGAEAGGLTWLRLPAGQRRAFSSALRSRGGGR